jgi:protein tyrosine/serine phosphatase
VHDRFLNFMKYQALNGRGWAAAWIFCVAMPAAMLAASQPEGVHNFQRVDQHVYRGAQPTDEGFRNLAELGIQTIVDLREPGSRSVAEKRTVEAAGMRYVSVPMHGMEAPSSQDVAKVLAMLEDTSTGPVFVHCMRGADRTGGVIACYRIEHDHWRHEQALDEAKSMGMSWFQKAIQRYVSRYQPRTLDSPATGTLSAQVAQ